MDEITVPVPESYKELADRLDEDMEEDVYEELGKNVMDIIHKTAMDNMEIDEEEDIDEQEIEEES